MGFIKTNLLKSIEWLDDSKDTIVYRFPMDGRQIMYGSKLTVRESQIAVFVNKGQIADIFEPGMYKLETSNLPILTQLFSWPYGFKSPFFAEVYFINTKQFAEKWGTSNPIAMKDKEFGAIRIRGFGSYAFKVDNPKVFLNELFGTNSTFTTENIHQYLKSMLVSSISDTIAESNISALDMACNLLEFSEATKETITEKFTSLGLKLTNFVIENISASPDVYIAGCTVKLIPTRGFLVSTRGHVLVENNEFYGLCRAAVFVANDAAWWYETGPVEDITIRNNRIYNQDADPIFRFQPENKQYREGEFVHKNILIENNEAIGEAPVAWLWAKSTDNIVLRGNKANFSPLANELIECGKVTIE